MLNLVINGMTGLIAALVIASLYQSLRAFFPAWRHLSAEAARLEKGVVLHATLREAGPEDIQRLTIPALPQLAMEEKPVKAPAPFIRQPLRRAPSPLLHATAWPLHT